VVKADPGVTDEELLRRFNGGGAEAFEVLLARYERPLFNFILLHVAERTRAEEILQDAFLRVIERSKEFKGESKFSTWLYTIARNLCIDESRKMVFRRHKSLDAQLGGDDGEGPALVERTAGSGPAVDRAAIARELKPQIAEAIAALPDARDPEHAIQGHCDDRRRARKHGEKPDAIRPRTAPRSAGGVFGLRRGARGMIAHQMRSPVGWLSTQHEKSS
jgi:RNA polymerase sigma factor (sigma-70 family)